MSLYDEAIEHTSPKIARYYNLENNTIKDKLLLKSYFEKALTAFPDLRFDLIHILEGQDSCVVLYKRMGTELVAEYLEFNQNQLIVKSKAHSI